MSVKIHLAVLKVVVVDVELVPQLGVHEGVGLHLRILTLLYNTLTFINFLYYLERDPLPVVRVHAHVDLAEGAAAEVAAEVEPKALSKIFNRSYRIG